MQGAPELIAEVAVSNASYDLHDKLNAYRRNGVREYVVWKVLEKEVVWFQLQNEQFVQKQPDETGLLKSDVFPGLWLDPARLISGEMAKVLQVLEQGLATAEQTAFVTQLQQTNPKK